MQHYKLLTHCLICQKSDPLAKSFITVEFKNAEFKCHICVDCRKKYVIQEIWSKILTAEFEKVK